MKRLIYLLSATALLASCSSGTKDSNITDQPQENETQTAPVEPHIVGKEITYTADSITMNGYLAYDENATEKKPGVIVVHEWWGHNEHSRNSAKKLAEMGYVAFALDMYGDGKQADHPQDAQKFAGAVMQDFEGAKSRFNAALKVLHEQDMVDTEKTGAIGYCFGGGIVLNMARQGTDLDAVASFHGSLGAVEPATEGSVKAKVLVMNGGDDPFVSAEQKAAFKEEMTNAGVDFEFIDYPGAVHAFTNPGATAMGEKFELPLAYNKEADEQSWQKMKAFFEAQLK